MRTHILKDLLIWRKSMTLVKEIYLLTESLPSSENYGLQNQMRRCAVSIPSNIAEGAGRNTPKEFCQFLRIATGSCYELETQLLLLVELNFKILDDIQPALNNLTEIQKMIYKFKNSLMSS